MSFFPDEVIIEVLARLPIKPLFKTRTVCKLWHGLPSDKYFVKLYNQVSDKNPMVLVEVHDSTKPNSSLICVDNSTGVSEFSLDFLRDKVNIRASCNGLLCCSSIAVKGVYYVCNPMTREFKVLPKIKDQNLTRFYPDSEATLVGLACDPSRGKFDVVLAGYQCAGSSRRPDKTFACLIFDSDSNKWRKFVSFQEEIFTHMNRNQVVYVNGALHWLTGSGSYILVLDLNFEVWRKVSVPDETRYGTGNRVYLLESDGCLSLIEFSDTWMKIWVMKDYERELWHMVDRVSLGCIKGLVHGIFPIAQTGECVFLATHKQVLVYHRTSWAWKEMYSVQNNATLPLWFSAHAFRTSIFPCE
ncbi:hypothetical protein Godav_018697 [Gossypium davidsonii]|uniref:F-box domain-containing protein n=1 Tax=Gossypium davidsonii TaxID=34287 RepID=A0A7J8QX81_GOSDV|nr:hypothetical protein [Gossypium davidsonii]